LARRGLIFTGIQEGTQPGGLTQSGQTEQGILTMCRQAGFRLGGAGQQELTRSSGAHSGGPGELVSVLCGLCRVFLLICIIVVPVPFVCCSVKLPLSRPTGFCLFLSIFLHTPAGGGAVMCRISCWLQPNHNNKFAARAWGGDNGRVEQQLLKLLS